MKTTWKEIDRQYYETKRKTVAKARVKLTRKVK